MAKWGMVINLEKCVGCQACTAACSQENTRMPGENWQDVLFYNEGNNLTWLPRPCMHCEKASCMSVCPTHATHRGEGGQILVDWDKCIGCKYCMIACPYGVRFYNDTPQPIQPDIRRVFNEGASHGLLDKSSHCWNPPYRMPMALEDHTHGVGVGQNCVVTKCNFCYHKVSKAPKGTADLSEADPLTREFTPACVRTCPATARFFGDLDNPNSTVSKLIADKGGVRLLDHMGNKPKVYYLTGVGGVVPSSRAKTA